MREYGTIKVGFWTHQDTKAFTNQGKVLAAYLLTGPHSNSLGCFRCPIGYIAEDLDWSTQEVEEAIKELEHYEFIFFDKLSGWLLLPHYLKHNPIANSKVAKSIAKFVNQVPKNMSFFNQLIESLKRYGRHLPEKFIDEFEKVSKQYRNGIETVSKPYRRNEHEHEHEYNNTSTKVEEGEPSLYFSKVIEACRGSNGNREKFNGYMFMNKMRKDYAAHLLALELAICKTNDKLNLGTMKGDPWPYALRIFQKENDRYNEECHLAEVKKFSSEVDAFLKTDQGKEILSHLNLAKPP